MKSDSWLIITAAHFQSTLRRLVNFAYFSRLINPGEFLVAGTEVAFVDALGGRLTHHQEENMLRKALSVLLAGLIIQLACAYPAFAGTVSKKDYERAEKVRAGIARLGTGPDARVKVKLRDRTKLEGYVSWAGSEQFTVTDVKTGAATSVEYSQVKQVKGNNLSTGAKIAIGVGIGVGVAILIFALVFIANEH